MPSVVGAPWTYSGSPAASDKDAVRFLSGDTNNGDQLLSDPEIYYLLTLEGSVRKAAAAALRQAVAQGRFVDKTVGPFTLTGSQRATQAMARAGQLEGEAHRVATVFAGGVSISDNDARDADTDVPTRWATGYDHPETSQPGGGSHVSVDEAST